MVSVWDICTSGRLEKVHCNVFVFIGKRDNCVERTMDIHAPPQAPNIIQIKNIAKSATFKKIAHCHDCVERYHSVNVFYIPFVPALGSYRLHFIIYHFKTALRRKSSLKGKEQQRWNNQALPWKCDWSMTFLFSAVIWWGCPLETVSHLQKESKFATKFTFKPFNVLFLSLKTSLKQIQQMYVFGRLKKVLRASEGKWSLRRPFMKTSCPWRAFLHGHLWHCETHDETKSEPCSLK